ncbi:MAG: YidC/Oxa1 family membrane protein insertase, partial [Patescibacteria group bacterium]|nr:YidC/Oxa1 family membrane protein insertase [Patescibacteria group bacterium]
MIVIDSIISIFNITLYQPLFNGLVLLYDYLPGHDFGIAVIVLTILIRILLYPLMVGSLKSQKALTGLQPKIQEIQNNFKEDRQK